MDDALTLARSELILGGQKSGKSRRAELLARTWLAASESHEAVLIATGQAWDGEMQERIKRHQRERAERVPGMSTVEEPLWLAQAIRTHSQPDTLLVVDCLTLWLTNWLMPADSSVVPISDWDGQTALLQEVLRSALGPVVLVSNEIGLGVVPMGAQVRSFVDALGRLNQEAAQVCSRVTLMTAGLPLTMKEGA